MKKIISILSVLLVVSIIITVYSFVIEGRRNEEMNQINLEKNLLENELTLLNQSNAELQNQLLRFEVLAEDNEIYIDQITEIEEIVQNLEGELQIKSANLEELASTYYYNVGAMNICMEMYENYIQSRLNYDQITTCLLPNYVEVGDDILGIIVETAQFNPVDENDSYFSGYSIEFEGELTIDAILSYNDYYGDYELLIENLEQIPHTPRDVNMSILINGQNDFIESFNYEVGDRLRFTISNLSLSFQNDKPIMNTASIVDIHN